jgi:hypothetical protein
VEDNQNDLDRVTAETVRRNFYVDDCLKSVATKEDGIRLISELHQMLARDGFKLTKWTSNNRAVLSSIPEFDRAVGIQSLDWTLMIYRWSVH